MSWNSMPQKIFAVVRGSSSCERTTRTMEFLMTPCGPDSMTHWIIKKSHGFADMGLYRISESVPTYAYLILSSQASPMLHTIGNTMSELTSQKAFLNNFENIMNHRVDIWEDIKRSQDTLSYASSKIASCMGKGIYMLPSNMHLNVKSGTAWYNNEILVSDSRVSLGKMIGHYFSAREVKP